MYKYGGSNMKQNMMWAILLHLGSNMWGKKGGPKKYPPLDSHYHETMYCDKEVWKKVVDALPGFGINTLLIDMGEGVQLDSHPELAIPGSWTKEEFKEELERIRSLGITPLPKFNFSCAHNAWMQEYGYMVGTETYYKVCEDVITETIEMFGNPEYFHLGLEEEDAGIQSSFPIKIIRSPAKKTEDAKALFKVCLDKGVRPWIWVDRDTMKAFGGEEAFQKNISKEVLISNWYYPTVTNPKYQDWVGLYNKLAEWGYDQIPTCSTIETPFNPGQTMCYCKETVKPGSVKGFMTAPWVFTRPEWYYRILSDAHIFGEGKKRFYKEEM